MIIARETKWREAIDAHKGERFLWIEPKLRDQEALGAYSPTALSIRCKKDFLLGKTGASGIYPPEAWWLIPKGVGPSWMRKHLSDLIATTDLIPDSPEIGPVFFHSGDLGDIIAALPSVRALGGGRIVIGHQPGVGNREAMRGARYEALRPLLEAQDYVLGVEYDDDPLHIDYNCALFRHDPIAYENLAAWQARHLGISNLDLSPWLKTPRAYARHGKVVVARTLRYHNQFFPWGELLNEHKGNVEFVGLEAEHRAFCSAFRQQVPFHPTNDLLELAEFIAGASLVICNQSLPYWVAIGLGMPLIQESYERALNSIVYRDNAIYTPTRQLAFTLLARLRKKKLQIQKGERKIGSLAV